MEDKRNNNTMMKNMVSWLRMKNVWIKEFYKMVHKKKVLNRVQEEKSERQGDLISKVYSMKIYVNFELIILYDN